MADPATATAPDFITEAQGILAKAVARARAGEDRELTQQVRQGGEAVASVLAGLLKLNRVHATDNRAFDVPIGELSRAVGSLVHVLGTVHLVTVADQVFVNDIRLRVEALAGLQDLGADLARHNVGGLTFHAALDVNAVHALITALGAKPAEVAPRTALQATLIERGVKTLELTPRLRFREHDEDRDQQYEPVEALQRAMRLVDETYANVAYGRILNPLPLRRSVAEILDLGPAIPAFWEALDQGSPHGAHAATVTLVSLLVGKAAGFGTGLLHDLGVAGLIHDVGYAGVPADVARGPEGLARHPGEGAKAILRQRGFHVAKLRRLRAILDHHRDHAEPRGRPSVIGEVLRIAEDYSTLVRVYQRRISPVDALGAMARAAGRFYHPVLMQATVNQLGRYPPGTILELEDGRRVRSIAPARSPETFANPLVRAVSEDAQAPLGEVLELSALGKVRRVLPG